MIGVREETLAQHGAVSEPVVVEMAIGALKAARADYAVSISGIAGPDGGSEESLSAPSGLLLPLPAVKALPGGNASAATVMQVRRQATAYALQTLWQQFLQKHLILYEHTV